MRRIGTRACLVGLVFLIGTAVGCGDSRAPGRDPAPGPHGLPEGAWYRGDLHSHSLHSDGDSPVAEVIAAAEQRGLDYFVITDHDGNMGGVPTQWRDPDYRSDRMILLFGVEWTTGQGHANVWAAAPFDYTALWAANRALDARAAVESAHEQGALFSINHPSAYLCCPWEYQDDAGYDALEVWNALYRLPNLNFLSSHRFWDERLLTGRRVPAVGGSDTHDLRGLQALYLRHGDPTTWVHAAEATAEGILAGIRAGRASLSHEPGAPRVEFTADTDGDGIQDVMMGDSAQLLESGVVRFEVSVRRPENLPAGRAAAGGAPQRLAVAGERRPADLLQETVLSLEDDEYVLLVLKNGAFHAAWKLAEDPDLLAFSDRVPAGTRVYYRVELLGKAPSDPIESLLRGWMKALSNPIYFGYPSGRW